PGGMDTNFQASSGVRRIENERLLDPADVADEMLHALDRGRVLAVVGMRARAMDVVGRVLPRPIQRRLWKRLVQGMR
ncbi:MAG: hypothetical protein SGJ13_05440, partial [Actinomycetota bacterium]|nr:hypothetical protein [Actinomycetota bacterium]